MASDFEVLVEAVHARLVDSSISWGLFRTAQSTHDQLRTVVWIPTTFQSVPVKYSNPMTDPDTGAIVDVLSVDSIVVECQITGTTFEDACLIRVQVLNAAHLALGKASAAIGGAYVTELQGESGYTWAGAAKIVQHFTWMLNVLKIDPTAGGQIVVEHIQVTDELRNAADNTASTPTETFEIPTP